MEDCKHTRGAGDKYLSLLMLFDVIAEVSYDSPSKSPGFPTRLGMLASPNVGLSSQHGAGSIKELDEKQTLATSEHIHRSVLRVHSSGEELVGRIGGCGSPKQYKQDQFTQHGDDPQDGLVSRLCL